MLKHAAIMSKIVLIILCVAVYVCGQNDFKTNKNGEKLRVCIVEGKGTYKKTTKYCPMLEQKSNIECVIGVDRLDCLRRIHKGSAHFGVFSSEELQASRWSGVEVLLTDEMRFHNTPFQYEVVAIVDNEANINNVQELRGSKLCHPGHGLQSHWTEVLANYFEATIVPRQCNEDMSLAESRIKASAEFFGPSCKAGPWVPDDVQDRILKRKYPSLCQLCYNPQMCGMGDKHWGRRGPLYCLSGGYGDVAWVRLDDAMSHFGFSGLPAETDPSSYSFLCPDGHLQPLTTRTPCVWVAKPWSAIAAQRNHAEEIQTMLQSVTHDNEDSWQNALLSLLESYHVNVTTLDTSIPIADYLDQAVGFQSAYSFASCSQPRSIVFCTSTILEHYKCSWLQETAQAYGIEPNIQCIRADSCLNDTKHHITDVLIVDQDQRVRAERDFNLKPLLYEFTVEPYERYVVVAVVQGNSNIHSFNELRGKRACFPEFEGAAYVSVQQTLKNLSLTLSNSNLRNFFSRGSCTWHAGSTNCDKDKHKGEFGALRCLAEGKGDVAFVNSATFQQMANGQIKDFDWVREVHNVRLLCPYGQRVNRENENCYLHWTTHGHLMIHNATQLTRTNEIYNSLRDMDQLFGKQYKSHTIPFSMFGPFDRKNNVIFRDTTDGLRGRIELEKDKFPRLMEQSFTETAKCQETMNSAQIRVTMSLNMGLLLIILVIYQSLWLRS